MSLTSCLSELRALRAQDLQCFQNIYVSPRKVKATEMEAKPKKMKNPFESEKLTVNASQWGLTHMTYMDSVAIIFCF